MVAANHAVMTNVITCIIDSAFWPIRLQRVCALHPHTAGRGTRSLSLSTTNTKPICYRGPQKRIKKTGAGSRCRRASHLGKLLAGWEVHGNDAAGDGVRRPRHGRVAPTEVVRRNVRRLGNTQVAAAATVPAPRTARRLQQQACRAEVHVRGCVVALGARVILQMRSIVSDIVVSVVSYIDQ